MIDRDEQLIAFEAGLAQALIHRGFTNVSPSHRKQRYIVRASLRGEQRQVDLCRDEMSGLSRQAVRAR